MLRWYQKLCWSLQPQLVESDKENLQDIDDILAWYKFLYADDVSRWWGWEMVKYLPSFA